MDGYGDVGEDGASGVDMEGCELESRNIASVKQS